MAVTPWIAIAAASSSECRPRPCAQSIWRTRRLTSVVTIPRTGAGTRWKNWAGPRSKLASSSQRTRATAQ
ncbi:hypothetical protein D3C86_1183980 [compost metagenome]